MAAPVGATLWHEHLAPRDLHIRFRTKRCHLQTTRVTCYYDQNTSPIIKLASDCSYMACRAAQQGLRGLTGRRFIIRQLQSPANQQQGCTNH
eukprot:scaffold92528_cov36-Prasinocladus_malaysianus.AAC.1